MSTRNNRAGEQKKNKKGNRAWQLAKTLLLLAVLAGITFGVIKVGLPVLRLYSEAQKIVEESNENTFKAFQTSIIYDAEGNEIKKLKGERDSYYLKSEDIPDAAKLAMISVEDKNFRTHRGFDVEGILRSVAALVINRGHITMGGSTITMQLSRNMFLSFEKSYSRKIEEIFISVALEQKYTKDQIMEFYLNNVYFANGCYGIEAASQTYFRKNCKDLSIAQIAFLCAIPNSPTKYDPYANPEATLTRRNKIIKAMYEEGYISEDQYKKSMEEDVQVLTKKTTKSNDYAETYIIKCAVEALMKEQGFKFKNTFKTNAEKEEYDTQYDETYDLCKQSLYTAGYRIYTSIDMDMQQRLQDSISTQLAMFPEKTDDGVFVIQGAATCIDNSTGRVVAIVGGREEDQEGYGLNRAFQSYRQPGSSIKPILVYAPALENGYTPDSIVDDTRMTGKDKVNNSGGSYSGHISLRSAVKKSSNVATYRLYQELGTDKCMKYLENLGFRGLEPEDYEYDTTCLGGFTKGTTTVEMAASYATIANKGKYRNPSCIVKITDAQGEVVVDDVIGEKEIYSEDAAQMMTDVLESCVSGGGTAKNCKLDTNIPVACKTGTTTSYVDGWLCGFSSYYTTAVWVGRDVFKPVDNLKGNTYPAYIWKNFMDKIHETLVAQDLSGMYIPQKVTEKKEATTQAATTAEKEKTSTATTEEKKTTEQKTTEEKKEEPVTTEEKPEEKPPTTEEKQEAEPPAEEPEKPEEPNNE